DPFDCPWAKFGRAGENSRLPSASCQKRDGPSVWRPVETVVFVHMNKAGRWEEIDRTRLRIFPSCRRATANRVALEGQSALPNPNSQARCERWLTRPTDQT